jgi:hypothetical protein
MRKAFKASRLISLLALAAGLMAFSAAGAHAEPGAYWEVGGVQIKDGTLLPQIQAEKDSKHSVLLTTVGLSKVEILCTEIKFIGAKLHELGRATGIIHYDNCETFLNGKLAAACKPHSLGDELGLIETNKLHGLIKLHELTGGAKDDLFELLPESGSIFVGIVFGMETKNECAIGEHFNITGKVFLKDCVNEGLVNKERHLFEEGPLSALLFGSKPATIDGSAWAFLEGSHLGQLWSGHAA